MKTLPIIAGIIAALIAADYFTIQYKAEREKLEYLCTYRFTSHCDCDAGDGACHAKCDALKESARTQCVDELNPTFYKLQDKFTWRLLIGLPLAFGVGWGMARGAGLLLSRKP